MDPPSFFLFLMAAITLNVTPGPDLLYVMSRSMNQGRSAGVLSALGLGLGYIGHTLAASLGLSALIMSSALVFQVIKYAGAAYLIYLGVQTLRSKPETTRLSDGPLASRVQLIRQGAITSLLNPKVALFFLAFLPQFVQSSSPAAILQFLVLGTVFTATATIWNTIVGVFSGYFGEQLQRNRRLMRIQQGFTGSVLIGLGSRLAFAEPR